MARVDAKGYANRGSQLQMQIYVNRREPELSAAVLAAFPDLAKGGARLQWTSPLEGEKFAEYRDAAFLRAIEREDLVGALADFWPARGPVWDGLAVIAIPGAEPGVVLAEGKSYPGEFYSGGTRATSPASLDLIRSAMEATQRWLEIGPDADRWMKPIRPGDPSSSLYQSANRYAMLYWLRALCGVDARLVHVLFEDDQSFKRATRAEWDSALPGIQADLGLAGVRVPHAAHAFLPARTRDELVSS